MKTRLLSLFLLNTSFLFAQNTHYSALDDYKKIGWMVNVTLFDRGINYVNSGHATPKHLPILSHGFGLNYNFQANKKWSLVSGLWAIREAGYHFQITIDEKDIIHNGEYFFPQGSEERYKGYTIYSFSSPLFLRYQLPAFKNGYIHSNLGLKIKFLPSGSIGFGIGVEDLDVFDMGAISPKNYWQGSFVIGTGLSWARWKYLIKADIYYTLNFQNSLEGYYKYKNLLVTPDSDGSYVLSGNYWALMLSIHLPSKKN